MSEGGRLFHPVTGGLAAVFLLLLTAGLVSHANRYHSNHSSGSEHGASQAQSSVPFSGPSGLSEQPSAEDRKEAREEADLAAQERMAAAAAYTVYIGALTLFLLSLTVFYAHKAWKAAAGANSAAADGAKAAWASENSARDIGQKQSMAYVHITRCYTPARPPAGDDDLLNALAERGPRLMVDVQNIGNTVAKFVALHVEWSNERDHKNWSVFRELQSPTKVETSNLAPTQIAPIQIASDIVKDTAPDELDIETDFAIRILRGIVTYENVFGQEYRTAFIYMIFFRPSQRIAPAEELEYKAFPFNGPAFQLIETEKPQKEGSEG